MPSLDEYPYCIAFSSPVLPRHPDIDTFVYINAIMYGDDASHDWFCDEETQSRPDDESCSDLPASRAVTPVQSQLRPARKTLSFVLYAN